MLSGAVDVELLSNCFLTICVELPKCVLRGRIHRRNVGGGRFEGNVAIGCPAVSEVTERRGCRLSEWIAVTRSSVVEDDAPATGNRAPETCRAVEVRQGWLRHLSMQPQPARYASSFVTLSHGI
jgi:hypothetical protein